MNVSRARPAGISIIAFLFLLEALIALGIAAFFLLLPNFSLHVADLFERLQLPGALNSLLALPPLLTAALAGIIFRGLWRLDDWARLAAIVFTFLLVLTSIVAVTFFAAFNILNATNRLISLLFGLGSLICFIYLVRTSFQLDAIAATAAPDDGLSSPFIPSEVAAATPLAPSSPGWVPPPPLPPQPPPTSPIQAKTVASPPPTQQLSSLTTPHPTPLAWLLVRTGPEMGQKFAILPGQSLTVGRDPAQVDVLLTDPTVSARHAQIRQEQGHLILYDLGSTNGTFIHDRPVHEHVLSDGDEIRLGSTILFFTTTP